LQPNPDEPLEINERAQLEVEFIPTTHFVCLAISYLILIFLCFLTGTDGIAAIIFFFAGAATCFATIQLCAVWAALGPGIYWQRALGALAVGAFVGIGAYLGMLFNGAFPDPLIGAGVFLSIGPIVWLVAQLPFLMMRFLCHWKLSSKPAFGQLTIPDIFGFLSVAAVCFASLQFTQLLPEIDGPRSIFNLVGNMIGSTCAASLLIQLFISIPCLSIIFGSDTSGDGFARVFGIGICLAFGLFFLLIILGGILGGGPQMPVIAFMLMLFFGTYAVAFCMPLMFHRDAGIQLWNRARAQAWLSRHEAPETETFDTSTADEALLDLTQ